MFITIPTWRVSLLYGDEKGVTYRVPETELDHFLHVMTFNRREFSVEREPDPSAAHKQAGT